MIIANPKVYAKYLELKCYEQTLFKPKQQKVNTVSLKSTKYEFFFIFSPKHRMHFSIKDRKQYRILYTQVLPKTDGIIHGNIKQHLRNTSLEVKSKLVRDKWDKELSAIQRRKL